jgi:hypothetical protein
MVALRAWANPDTRMHMREKVIFIQVIVKITSAGATTLSIMTISMMTFCIMTLSIKGLYVTLSFSDYQHE